MTPHWTEAYIGWEWTPGRDCAWFCRKVVSEQFGRRVTLPSGFDWKETAPAEVVRLARSHAAEIPKPREGAIALLEIQGRARSLGSHVGVVAMMDGDPWILHLVERIGSIFHPADASQRLQLEVRGYYELYSDA